MKYAKIFSFALVIGTGIFMATQVFADSVSPATVTEGAASTYVLVDCSGASGGNVIANLFSSSGDSTPINTAENAGGPHCQLSPHFVSVPSNLPSGTYYIDVYSTNFLIADGTETRSAVESSAGFVESMPITVVGESSQAPTPTPTPVPTATPTPSPTPIPTPTQAPVDAPAYVPGVISSGGSVQQGGGFNAGLLSAGRGLDTDPVSTSLPSSPSSGGQVLGASVAAPHPDGTLVLDGQTVYLIRSGQRYAFRSAAEFKTYGYSFDQVVSANSGDLALPFSAQNILKAKEGSVILDASDNRTVYVIGDSGTKQGFTSAAAFEQHGYSFTGLPIVDLSDYPSGGVITGELSCMASVYNRRST